mmetsp:Transcript_28024/g.70320  ORF Transcript_28024/g.70320 Transcript_28024/m.70320 type:complete len:101 (+) Transcript_28024:1184-1486(+)
MLQTTVQQLDFVVSYLKKVHLVDYYRARLCCEDDQFYFAENIRQYPVGSIDVTSANENVIRNKIANFVDKLLKRCNEYPLHENLSSGYQDDLTQSSNGLR